ncbi:E3 ubiquitin-protein ligase TRIM56-like [Mytilus trossulus]|uniref:E3 ubiquitin-protein ligase TRIM56-like n=1 Tax=Mytilus trossulus TaxID=6551 RepID=UPI003005C304
MNVNICQPCETQDKHEAASHWCSNCNEQLCAQCSDYHKALKITKDHQLLTLEEYKALSPNITEISLQCKNHNENPIRYYCPTHNTPCCSLCKINDHNECHGVENIEELDQTSENERNSESMYSKIDHAIQKTEKACAELSENLKHLQHQRIEFVAAFQDRKEKIQKVKDEIDTKKDLFEQEYEIKRQNIEKQNEKLQNRCDELKKRKESMQILSKLTCGNKCHVFLAKNYIKEQNKKDEIEIQHLVEQLTVENCLFNIEFKLDQQNVNITLVANISFSADSCAFQDNELNMENNDSSTVEEENRLMVQDPCHMDASVCSTSNDESKGVAKSMTKWKSEACLLSEANKKSDESSKLVTRLKRDSVETRPVFKHKFRFQIEKKNPNIFLKCVGILPSGNLIIGECSNPRLLIYSKTGCKKGEMSLKTPSTAITVVNDTQIAVTSGKSVLIVDVKRVDSMQIANEIKLLDDCHGIAYVDKYLAVNCVNEGLKLLTLSGFNKCTYFYLKGVLNICAYQSRIVFSAKRNSEMVHRLNLESNNRLNSRCPNLFGANGITIECNGDIFITCDKSNKVYMLRNGPPKWNIILTEDNGIDKPKGIAYDNKTNEIFVLNNDGKSICIFERKIM